MWCASTLTHYCRQRSDASPDTPTTIMERPARPQPTTPHVSPSAARWQGLFFFLKPPRRTENDAAARRNGAKIGADNTDPIPPLSARSFPRLARTQKPRFFVQMCRPPEGPPGLALFKKMTIEKIVHSHASLCAILAGKKNPAEAGLIGSRIMQFSFDKQIKKQRFR